MRSTVKMIIAIQAKTGAHSMGLDVKGAYLKSCIQEGSGENLYIRYPNGTIHKLNKCRLFNLLTDNCIC